MKRKFVLAMITTFVFVMIGMGMEKIWKGLKRDVGRQKPVVVTSFYPLFFLAREIGGERVDVMNLTPSGVEPHDYEPTVGEIMSVVDASILVVNGGGFEPWLDRVRMDLGEVVVVETAKDLMKENDPHVWLSPELMKKEADLVMDGLIKTDPEGADYYRENRRGLVDKLDKLISDYKNGLSLCKNKTIVTSHEAFGYLAGDFGLKEVSISGLNPDEEPSANKISEVVKVIREEKVNYVFFESLVSPKLAKVVADEAGVETLSLDPIEGVSDTDRQAGKDYLTIMRDNLAVLRRAMRCQ